MTADSDLIRRDDAIAEIRKELKRTYTAARRQGYKQSAEILARLPAVPQHMADVPTVVISPGLGHSHWFIAGGFRLCHNCGGEGRLGKPTAFCPHCGFIMDELMDLEIE